MNPLRRRSIPALAPPVQTPTYAIPEGMRIYAVGDIHGRSGLLERMFAAIAQDVNLKPSCERIVQVFLGDYIDRGLHSREVIDLLLTPLPRGQERVCLMGNHEDALLTFLKDPRILREWANFGGYATLASYGVGIPESMSPQTLAILRDGFLNNLPEDHLLFLRTLELSYIAGDYLFVHAGIKPNIELSAQERDHLLWIRDAFLNHKGFHDYYIVHGHSPVVGPEILENRANIDVSAASVNSLCCLVLDATQRNIIVVTDEND